MPRVPEYDIERWFLDRWSPRAMDGKTLQIDDLMRLFEAARWSPSCFNAQPWRFVYSIAGSEQFGRFLDLLVAGNRVWCERAGALIVVASKLTFDNGSPSRTHSFDTGAAWMGLALQASRMGLVAHGMAGFDYDRVRDVVNLPEGYAVEAMIALGYPGRAEELPEKYYAREIPSDRKPVREFAFADHF
jgi:nitroreductase